MALSSDIEGTAAAPGEDEHVTASACPACLAAPSAEQLAKSGDIKGARLMLSLPTAHCAVCITDVERELQRQPGVKSARVNLTLKRVSVDAEPGAEAAPLIAALERIGYEAHELDAGMLSATDDEYHALVDLGLVGGRRRHARHVPLDFRRHRDSHRAVCRPAVFLQRLGGVAGAAAGHGCADLAGDHSGLGDLALRNRAIGPPRLFRRRRDADLLPAGRPLP
jgi:copper chaperone CopZ